MLRDVKRKTGTPPAQETPVARFPPRAKVAEESQAFSLFLRARFPSAPSHCAN
jgi:hypothetical protein